MLACALGPRHRAYVLDGLKRQADCLFLESFDELDEVLRGQSQCDAVILAPIDSRNRTALSTVERLAADWPDTAIVILFPSRIENAPSPRLFAVAGAHQFVFEGVNNTATTVAVALASARRECVADVVFRSLQQLVPSSLHSVVQEVVSNPDTVATVEQLAPALGVHRKTLVNRCARSSFLAPAELIAWCRLCVVGYLLERSGATIESIALTQGFASHTALRNLIKRYTRQTATEIRRSGGLRAVIEAWQRRLESLRSVPRLPTT